MLRDRPPKYVDDLPLAIDEGELDVVEELLIGDLGAGDVAVDVEDFHFDVHGRWICFTQTHASPLDHAYVGSRLQEFASVRHPVDSPLGQLRAEGSLHPGGVAGEPAFDVIKAASLDRRFVIRRLLLNRKSTKSYENDCGA